MEEFIIQLIFTIISLLSLSIIIFNGAICSKENAVKTIEDKRPVAKVLNSVKYKDEEPKVEKPLESDLMNQKEEAVKVNEEEEDLEALNGKDDKFNEEIISEGLIDNNLIETNKNDSIQSNNDQQNFNDEIIKENESFHEESIVEHETSVSNSTIEILQKKPAIALKFDQWSFNLSIAEDERDVEIRKKINDKNNKNSSVHTLPVIKNSIHERQQTPFNFKPMATPNLPDIDERRVSTKPPSVLPSRKVSSIISNHSVQKYETPEPSHRASSIISNHSLQNQNSPEPSHRASSIISNHSIEKQKSPEQSLRESSIISNHSVQKYESAEPSRRASSINSNHSVQNQKSPEPSHSIKSEKSINNENLDHSLRQNKKKTKINMDFNEWDNDLSINESLQLDGGQSVLVEKEKNYNVTGRPISNKNSLVRNESHNSINNEISLKTADVDDRKNISAQQSRKPSSIANEIHQSLRKSNNSISHDQQDEINITSKPPSAQPSRKPSSIANENHQSLRKSTNSLSHDQQDEKNISSGDNITTNDLHQNESSSRPLSKKSSTRESPEQKNIIEDSNFNEASKTPLNDAALSRRTSGNASFIANENHQSLRKSANSLSHDQQDEKNITSKPPSAQPSRKPSSIANENHQSLRKSTNSLTHDQQDEKNIYSKPPSAHQPSRKTSSGENITTNDLHQNESSSRPISKKSSTRESPEQKNLIEDTHFNEVSKTSLNDAAHSKQSSRKTSASIIDNNENNIKTSAHASKRHSTTTNNIDQQHVKSSQSNILSRKQSSIASASNINLTSINSDNDINVISKVIESLKKVENQNLSFRNEMSPATSQSFDDQNKHESDLNNQIENNLTMHTLNNLNNKQLKFDFDKWSDDLRIVDSATDNTPAYSVRTSISYQNSNSK